MLRCYAALSGLLKRGEFQRMVVANPWQTLEKDSLDGLLPEHPDHLLWRALAELEADGADVLFAVPDHHAKRIHGASSPSGRAHGDRDQPDGAAV